MPCHFTAAFAAGFCTTLVASPVDVVKTRYMNSEPGHYRGALNCALSMLVNEGPTSFYKGYEASASFQHMSDYFDVFLDFFFADSCRRIFVWGPGTLWCLWPTSRFREPWWRFRDDCCFLPLPLFLRLLQVWACLTSSGLAEATDRCQGRTHTRS